MAGTSLLALIDKIAVVLDDVALMTKVAAKKTAGVLGDDLALNAQQVQGVKAEREIPVVWAVAKGSFINKLILVPAALLTSSFIPWLITPLLMLGGLYLCFEGIEKISHSLFTSKESKQLERQKQLAELADENIDMLKYEQDKIKGAIKTDFILSAEIIVIALGTVQDKGILEQSSVVALIAIIMTIGVYGLVASIVKLDDLGLYLLQKPIESNFYSLNQLIGKGLLSFAPKLMKTLAIVGTAAMFLVGGGILVHGAPLLHHPLEILNEIITNMNWLLSPAYNAIIGMLAGSICLVFVTIIHKLKTKMRL
jgi:predicted DNA repair protein MutK